MRPYGLLFSLTLALLTFTFSDSKAASIDVEGKAIKLALTTEPPNLDSSLTTDTISTLILGLTNEGLVRTNRKGDFEPGVAERWEVDGLEVTFYLRESYWSDGKPVIAHDFEYALKRLVDPETGAGSSTFFCYILENGTEILAGKKPVDTLGVKAISDKVLKVTLSHPVPYFLMPFSVAQFRPLRKDFVEQWGGSHGADAGKILSNGPFVLTEWTHSASLKVEKNPYYWDQDDIEVNEIDFAYITADVRSLLNLYKTDEIAALRLTEEILKDTVDAGIRVQKSPTNCLNWMEFNLREDRPTKHLKLRQAIAHALDRDRYANIIVGLPGTLKSDSIFTSRIRGLEGNFIDEFPPTVHEYSPEAGRKLLKELEAEVGKIPPLVILVNERRQVEAEYIQSQLKTALGLDIKVDKQTFKQSLVKLRNGDFDLARAGFCSDALRDPSFFARIFRTGTPFNDMGFSNPTYDELVDVTESTMDQSVRMKAFAEMQRIIGEQLPVLPTHETAWIYVQKRNLRGLVRYPAQDFSRAMIMGATP